MKYSAEVTLEKDNFDSDALGKVLIALNVIAISFFAGWGGIKMLGGALLGEEEENTERESSNVRKSTSVVQVLKNQSRVLKRLVSNVSKRSTTEAMGAVGGQVPDEKRSYGSEEGGGIEMEEVVVGVNPMVANITSRGISRGQLVEEPEERKRGATITDT